MSSSDTLFNIGIAILAFLFFVFIIAGMVNSIQDAKRWWK